MSSPVTDIRLITTDDAKAITAHICRDAAATARWDPPRSADYYTLEGQRRRIERMLLRHATGESWPGVVLDGDAVIGQITVQEILQRAWRKASLGYWIGVPHQGQGHATRAVGLAIRLMISDLGLHRAEAFTQIENTASQNVLRKNRFLPVGTVHAYIFTDGAWHDEIFWERVLDEDP
jgi:ribosomal-protein-alanine N-acetyltransferase